MAFCTNCGQQLNNGVKFCIGCGTPTGRQSQVTHQEDQELVAREYQKKQERFEQERLAEQEKQYQEERKRREVRNNGKTTFQGKTISDLLNLQK